MLSVLQHGIYTKMCVVVFLFFYTTWLPDGYVVTQETANVCQKKCFFEKKTTKYLQII